MNKQQLKTFAREAAKSIKTESDLLFALLILFSLGIVLQIYCGCSRWALPAC